MAEANGWTMTAVHGWGTLKKGDLTIEYGTAYHINKNATSPSRINLRDMAHGMDDSKDKAIPCFIAAADLIHRELSQHGKVCINCGNGNSRTAFALMTYLIRHQSFSWTEASEFVSAGQAGRSDIDFKLRTEGPNGSYCEWIESSIKKITGEKTTDYIGGHVKLTSKSDANKSVFSVVPNASKKRKRKADEQQEALSLETLRPRKIRKTAEARMLEEAHAFIGNGFDRYQLRSGEFYGES